MGVLISGLQVIPVSNCTVLGFPNRTTHTMGVFISGRRVVPVSYCAVLGFQKHMGVLISGFQVVPVYYRTVLGPLLKQWVCHTTIVPPTSDSDVTITSLLVGVTLG